MNITNLIIEHIDPHIHQGDEHLNSLKSTISTPNSDWKFLHSMLYKIICSMLLCTFKAKVTTCKTIEYVLETLSKAIISTPIAIHKWFNKSQIRCTKKHCKTSNGSEKFSHNLRARKQPCYNKQNCNSERHGCQHTFMKRKYMTKRAATNNSSQDLKIKGRKLRTFKSPPPQILNRMLQAINNRANRQDLNNNEHHSLPYDKPDLCKDYISMEQDNTDRFYISFPRHCVFGHVLSNTDPLDDVDSWKEAVRPSKKPKSVGPRRSNPIQTAQKTTSNKKLQQMNKKSRSVSIQLPGERNNKSREPRSGNTLGHIKPRSEHTPNDPISTISDIQELRSVDDSSTPQRMTSVAGHPKNRLYINSGASLHILFNKELLGELNDIKVPIKIQAGGKPFHIKKLNLYIKH